MNSFNYSLSLFFGLLSVNVFLEPFSLEDIGRVHESFFSDRAIRLLNDAFSVICFFNRSLYFFKGEFSVYGVF